MPQNIPDERDPLGRVEYGDTAPVSIAGKYDNLYDVGYLEDLRREWPD